MLLYWNQILHLAYLWKLPSILLRSLLVGDHLRANLYFKVVCYIKAANLLREFVIRGGFELDELGG